ncbi:MAG: PD-(D/E)XK nuclease family protein [Prevotella sp.]|nr:PD-(D/E)XK nuclease family protein [Prevotella sp.]
MTKSFLTYVAEDILSKYGTNLSRVAVVFPNKRASLFLNEHLARLAGKPIWSPAYITISDLFRQHSQCQVADTIKSICELHKSFTNQTGTEETLDHFFGWGQLLLNDFDDIDKQMADASRVFANVTDLHEMDDDSFLTEEQRHVLHRFFSNFSEESNSELKQRFLRLWTHMNDIYIDFNQRLKSQNLAYEGALYREVVTQESLEFNYDVYLFVGFNVLLQVEHRLFTLLRRQGKAHFYWDFDQYYMKDNEAGHFISQYLADFPNELDNHDERIYNNLSTPRRIVFASAATENIQARYAASWLENINSPSRETAIVLCNENLLPTIIHCIPSEVKHVNITTGYPLAQSPVASLIGKLIALRRDGYDHQEQHFRIRQVKALLHHPYLINASPQIPALLQQLDEENNFFPTYQQLNIDELTGTLFQPFGPVHQNEDLLTWLCSVVQSVAKASHEDASPLKEECLFRSYTLLNRLLTLSHNGDLTTDIITLGRLISQLTQATTVPFHGEPAEGLQIMGILETRNLDFQHLLILSAQEGNMPRGANETSFIPYSLRKAYGLTTPDHKVAIYSYYFHRLLQRCEDVTIVYNNATNDGQKGEMSRFLQQLLVEYPHPIKFLTLQGGQGYNHKQPQPIANRATPPHELSPSHINRYLRCPLLFHYYYVEQLRKPDDTDDDIVDDRIFGNIFHEASRIIYSQLLDAKGGIATRPVILKSDIDKLLKEQVSIQRAVDDAFRQELFKIHNPDVNFQPRLNGLQLINREVIIHYLRQLLLLDSKLAPFSILGMEEHVSMKLDLQQPGQSIRIGGRIDRMDLITDSSGQQRIRVVDYKTGSRVQKNLPDIDAVFMPENIKHHSDYYLQALFYSIIIARQHRELPVTPALLFIQHAGGADYDPTLRLGKEPINNVSEYTDLFLDQLRQIITKMYNPAIPLVPNAEQHHCKHCPYRQLCF